MSDIFDDGAGAFSIEGPMLYVPAVLRPDQIDLIADAVSARVQGWQPIETAPRDGTPVLVWGVWIGEVYGEAEGGPQAGVAAYSYNSWSLTLGDCYSCECHATHWMPLPPPPEK